MNPSLISGFLPIAVQVVAAVVLLLAIGWRTRTWRRGGCLARRSPGWHWPPPPIGSSGIRHSAEGSGPVLLWLWIFLAGLSIVVAIAGWPGARWWRRAISLVAVPLCALCVALAVNAWTGYLPTVASAWNRATDASLPTQVDEATALDMQRRHEIPERGVMVSVTTPDDASGFRHRDELVYLPPAWFGVQSTRRHCPPS